MRRQEARRVGVWSSRILSKRSGGSTVLRQQARVCGECSPRRMGETEFGARKISERRRPRGSSRASQPRVPLRCGSRGAPSVSPSDEPIVNNRTRAFRRIRSTFNFFICVLPHLTAPFQKARSAVPSFDVSLRLRLRQSASGGGVTSLRYAFCHLLHVMN